MSDMTLVLTSMAAFKEILNGRRADEGEYIRSVWVAAKVLTDRARDVRSESDTVPADLLAREDIGTLAAHVSAARLTLGDLLYGWSGVLVNHGADCDEARKVGAELPDPLHPALLIEGAGRMLSAELALLERKADLAYLTGLVSGLTKAPERPAWKPQVIAGGAADAAPC